MALSFLTDLNLNDNEIQNVALQTLAADPTGVAGKVYFNTASNKIRVHNGTGWAEVGVTYTASEGLTLVGNDFQIATSGVTSTKIATGAVIEAKIGTGAVTNTKIATGAVDTYKIADGNVFTNNLANSVITEAKLSTDHVYSPDQVLSIDAAGFLYWKDDADTNTTYTAGAGLSLTGTVFSHADTSAQASVNNSGRTYIQDITLDTYGHITGIVSATETVVNTDVDVSVANLTSRLGELVGDVTIGTTTDQNIIIAGNLIVQGDQTTLNTTELAVEDNIITLNSNVTAAPSLNAGIEIERGTSANVYVRWNETTDRWEFTNNGTNYYNLPLSTEYTNNIGDITAVNITASGGLTGSVNTASGDHTQTIQIATDGVTNTHIATDAVNADSIAANAVGASELNVTGNGTTSQYLRSDGDGTFTWATPPNDNTQLSQEQVQDFAGPMFNQNTAGIYANYVDASNVVVLQNHYVNLHYNKAAHTGGPLDIDVGGEGMLAPTAIVSIYDNTATPFNMVMAEIAITDNDIVSIVYLPAGSYTINISGQVATYASTINI